MPPKKTKPNEKCPCGSGKKHKKCCMVAAMVAASSAPPPPTATTVLSEVMEALTLATTASNAAAGSTASKSSGPCLHGNTSTHFPDGRAYSDVIQEFLAASEDPKRLDKFNQDHREHFKDPNFGRYIFAVCTSWYLKMYTTNGDMKVLLGFATVLLGFATVHKYSYDSDKVKRYVRAINQNDHRGVINCLSRETKSFCDCMQDKKMEAKGMAKTERCEGCRITFPRTGMLICGGCKISMFCNEDCQTQNWPEHKEMCQGLQKLTAAARETVPSGKNDQNN